MRKKRRLSEPVAIERLLAELWRERDAMALLLLRAEASHLRRVGNLGHADPLTHRAWTAVFSASGELSRIERDLADVTRSAINQYGDTFVSALVQDLTNPNPTPNNNRLGGNQ